MLSKQKPGTVWGYHVAGAASFRWEAGTGRDGMRCVDVRVCT